MIEPEVWTDAKDLAVAVTGLSRDALHVLAGVAVQLLVAWLSRRSLAHGLPWLAVALLQLANEAYDLWVEQWPSLAMQVSGGLRDTFATLLLPTVLLLIARARPQLLSGKR